MADNNVIVSEAMSDLIIAYKAGSISDATFKASMTSLWVTQDAANSEMADDVSFISETVKGRLLFGPVSNVVAGGTTDLGAAASHLNNITAGASAIGSFGASANLNNPVHFCKTAVAGITLTNSATLLLPGGANIVTAANDYWMAEYLGLNGSAQPVWRVQFYYRASGVPVGAVSSVDTALTGNPTAPTQSASDSSTKIATTAQVQAAIAAKVPRGFFATHTSFWVSPTGNDANTGLSRGLPKQTIASVLVDIFHYYDTRGYQAIINLEDGSYGAGAQLFVIDGANGPSGGTPRIVIQSADENATPGSYNEGDIVLGGMAVFNGFVLILSHADISPGATGVCLQAYAGGDISLGNKVRFAAAAYHVSVSDHGRIQSGASYKIIGGATYHIAVSQFGRVQMTSGVVISAGLSFSGVYASSYYDGMANIGGFSGSSFTGKKYEAGWNGIILGGSSVPGSIAGTFATQGLVS